MDQSVRAIETTGRVIDPHHIETTVDLPVGQQVRLVVLWPDVADDESELAWRRAAAQSGAFDFLKDSQEDVYTLEDGEPLDLAE